MITKEPRMPSSTSVATATAFKADDYVLYRNPERFWRGEAAHTFVCRVSSAVLFAGGEWRYNLQPMTGGLICEARGDYMRLLPPADVMHDIDTAPLNTGGAAVDMTAAATAWLTQQHATANRRPDLPVQRD
ncbi:hypothetical protein [Streptomyces sp. LaBMicrA B280]|uniref:hypothetical protein n=1 Tax=Streptomyces sp. LaBMicrA B280 TaxID=3391001 RepID=UPI003BA5C58C